VELRPPKGVFEALSVESWVGFLNEISAGLQFVAEVQT
jgi:hypothetical protein